MILDILFAVIPFQHGEMHIYRRYNYFYLLGIHIINLRKTWEKLVLAARIIAGIENPEDVCVISSRPYGTVSCYTKVLH